MPRGLLALILVLGLCVVAWSDGNGGGVLGSCGTPSENEAAPATDAMAISGILLPGTRAVNFELPAVVGNDIKKVKLSDYNGKWRVVCFYPADFTFV